MDRANWYEIRIKESLDNRWACWFEGLAITNEAGGETMLRGPLADQTALHGVLEKIRNFNLTLISVNAMN